MARVSIKESNSSRPDGPVMLIVVDQGRLQAAATVIVTSHFAGSGGSLSVSHVSTCLPAAQSRVETHPVLD